MSKIAFSLCYSNYLGLIRITFRVLGLIRLYVTFRPSPLIIFFNYEKKIIVNVDQKYFLSIY